MEVLINNLAYNIISILITKQEHGFVKLMEALNTLGMDVVHATVTSHKSLVSNVFKVEVNI
jgi:hypothetical protein